MERILAAVAACLVLASCMSSSVIEERLLDLHNKERSERRLDSLALDIKLCEYAQVHAERMAEKGRLVHSSMSDLAVVAGNGNVGENIAWGQESEAEATETWMRSPGHRQNILSKRFKRVGFGMKKDKKGRPYWCAVFAG